MRSQYLEKVQRLQQGGLVAPEPTFGDYAKSAVDTAADWTSDVWKATSQKASELFAPTPREQYEQQLLTQQAKESTSQSYEKLKQDFAILAQHLYTQQDEVGVEMLSRLWDSVSAMADVAMAFKQGGVIEAPAPKVYDGKYVAKLGNTPYYFDEGKRPVRPINLDSDKFPSTLQPIDAYKTLLDGESSQRS